MTRKEMENFCRSCKSVKKGYVCYQDDKLSTWDLKEIGHNSGVYGWNWTLYYYPETDTAYVSGYRNY